MNADEKYKIALETRNLEIRLFWDRSNFFLALNTAIAVGFFSLNNRAYAPFLAFFGLVCSTLWVLANLGSKFWQARWEHKLAAIEREAYPDAKLFSESYEEISAQVADSLSAQSRSLFGKWLDRCILRRPSVSRMAILLSAWFDLSWFGLFIWSLVSRHG
jgi:hypothetical protein